MKTSKIDLKLAFKKDKIPNSNFKIVLYNHIGLQNVLTFGKTILKNSLQENFCYLEVVAAQLVFLNDTSANGFVGLLI